MSENTNQVRAWNRTIATITEKLKAQIIHNNEAATRYIETSADKKADLFVLGMTLATESMIYQLGHLEELNDLISKQI